MTTELILLGLLNGKPMTGYEMKKVCKNQFLNYTDINTSSIYTTLKRFEKATLIKGKTVQGERLEKNIFTITDLGKKYFIEILEQELRESSMTGSGFNAALTFAEHMDKKKLKLILEERKKIFQTYFEKIISMHDECKDKKKILFDRGISHVKAEISWIKQAIEELK